MTFSFVAYFPQKNCLFRTRNGQKTTTKQQNNKTTKQQNNKTTKQQNNKTTKQQNNNKGHCNSPTFQELYYHYTFFHFFFDTVFGTTKGVYVPL